VSQDFEGRDEVVLRCGELWCFRLGAILLGAGLRRSAGVGNRRQRMQETGQPLGGKVWSGLGPG